MAEGTPTRRIYDVTGTRHPTHTGYLLYSGVAVLDRPVLLARIRTKTPAPPIPPGHPAHRRARGMVDSSPSSGR
jgi:hypothetical protein